MRVIEASEADFVKRGRKADLRPDLAEACKTLPKGKILLVDVYGEQVAKQARSTVRAKIRAHWKAVRNEAPEIRYTSAGTPQVARKGDFAKKA